MVQKFSTLRESTAQWADRFLHDKLDIPRSNDIVWSMECYFKRTRVQVMGNCTEDTDVRNAFTRVLVKNPTESDMSVLDKNNVVRHLVMFVQIILSGNERYINMLSDEYTIDHLEDIYNRFTRRNRL